MENSILENNFETVYREYKEYKAYLDSVSAEVEKQREGFKQKVISSGESDETLIEELYDLSIKPMQSQEDLRILRERLLNVYDAYKIFLDFPVEIKEEIKNIERPFQTYRIYNGEQEEINKVKSEKYREVVRKTHLEIISALKMT